MARDVTCTDPDSLLEAFPCLNCATPKQLLVILTGLMMVLNGAQNDIDAAEQAAARFRNLSNREFLQALIASLPDALFADLTEQNLTQDFGCLQCYSEQQLKGILLNQWCTFWSTQ